MFTDDPEDQSDESRNTGGRDPPHQPTAGIEVPSCRTKVNTSVSGQGNLSAFRYSRGGSRYAPRESVDHRENPPVAPVVVRRQGTAQTRGHQEICALYDSVLTELREDVEQEYNRRHDLLKTVRRLRTDREKDRSEFAFAQLENERDIPYLLDEPVAALRSNALMKDQHEIGPVITRICWGSLSVPAVSVLGRGLVLKVRAETTYIERRMRAHPTRKLNSVHIALSLQYTKETNVIRQQFTTAKFSDCMSR